MSTQKFTQGFNQEEFNLLKITSLILAVLLILGAAPMMPVHASSPEGYRTQTIMVYMVGSDLESEYSLGTKDITEMLRSGMDTEKITVLVMTGGAKKWANTVVPNNKLSIFKIAGRSPELVHEEPQRSMGDPETLSSFLNFAVARYPAESYGLILWDHGAGPMIGFGVDEMHKPDILTLPELQASLKQSPFQGEQRLEWLAFDACLMASVEVASLMVPYARYMIASEEVLPGDGFSYGFLGKLGNTSLRGDEVSRIIMDQTYQFYEDIKEKSPTFNMAVTLSLVDLDKIAQIEKSVDRLFEDLKNGFEIRLYSDVARRRDTTKVYGVTGTTNRYDMVDLDDLAENMAALYPEEAAAVKKSIQDAVLYNLSNQARSAGLAIYFPFNSKAEYDNLWRDLYKSFDIMPIYQGFMERFGEVLLSGSLSDWLGDSAPPIVYDAASGAYAIQLSAEQIANYDRAEYYILANMTGEQYSLIYMSGDVTLTDSGRLQANFDGNVIYIGDDETGLIPVPFLRETENIDGIAKYQIPVLLERYTQEGAHESTGANIIVELDKKTGKARIIGAIRDDTEGNMMGKRDIRLEDWDIVDLMYLSFYLTRGESGDPLVLGDWVGSDDYASVSLKTSAFIRVEYGALDTKSQNYSVMITAVDTQGYAYPSELMPMSAHEEHQAMHPEQHPVISLDFPLENQKPQILSDKDGLQITLMEIGFDALSLGDRQAPDTLLVKLLVENKKDAGMLLQLDWLSVNEFMIPADFSHFLTPGQTIQESIQIPIAPNGTGSSLVDHDIRKVKDIRFRLRLHSTGVSILDVGEYSDEFRLTTDFPVGAGYEKPQKEMAESRVLSDQQGILIEQIGEPFVKDGKLLVPLRITNRSEYLDTVKVADSTVNGIMAGLMLEQQNVMPGTVLYTHAAISLDKAELPPDMEPYREIIDSGDNLANHGITQIKDIRLRFVMDHHALQYATVGSSVAQKTGYVLISFPGMEGFEQPLDTKGAVLLDRDGLQIIRLKSDPTGRMLYLHNSGKSTIKLSTSRHVWVDDVPYSANHPINLVLAPESSAYHKLFSFLPGILPEGQNLRFLLSVLDLDGNKLLFRTDDISLALN